MITGPDRVGVVNDRFGLLDARPRIIVLTSQPDPAATRGWLAEEVAAVVDVASIDPIVQAHVAVGAAGGGCVAIPPSHGPSVFRRLEDPPRLLTGDEEKLLSLAATRSVEAAGRAMGLGRRQVQRRFKQLCDDLNLDSRLHAAVAAARWGLVDANGNQSSNSANRSLP